MPVDPALHSLTLVTSPNDPSKLILLANEKGEVGVRRPTYLRTVEYTSTNEQIIHLSEPVSAAELAVLAFPLSSTTREITLLNPLMRLQLRSTGRITWEWSWEFEQASLVWRRDILGLSRAARGYTLWLLRGRDPPVNLASYRPSLGSGVSSMIQIFDYNISRFDFDDRRGFEIAIVAAVLSFIDAGLVRDNSSSLTSPRPPVERRAQRPSPEGIVATFAEPASHVSRNGTFRPPRLTALCFLIYRRSRR